MKFSFTRFKDRISGAVNATSQALGTAPRPVRAAGYGALRGLLWLIYACPRSHMRKTVHSLAVATGNSNPRGIYAGFVKGLGRVAYRMELISQGRTGEIDALFRLPEKDRFEALVNDNGGALLVMPHCHGSLLMVRGLAARYPTLMLIREPRCDARAGAQRRYFAHMGCEVLDVRRNSEAMIARAVLKALRQGKIVIGTVDRIKKAPSAEEPVSKTSDNVRVTMFGQPVGIAGWPARFAAKAKVPILPVMCEHTADAVTLHLGEPIVAGEIQATTQIWAGALERFFQRFPSDWIFAYDKHWARALNAQAKLLPLSGGDVRTRKTVDCELSST
jgi:KDO2-lipid IV(A) lauroyltransferase